MVSIDGGSASKVDDVTAYPEPSKDGGYVLLWQRYDNNKMVAMRYYGNVFYIFNSTVIDWTSEVFLKAGITKIVMQFTVFLAKTLTFQTPRPQTVQFTVHPVTCHESPEGSYRYSSTISLTSVLDEGGWSTPRPGRFTPGKEARCRFYRRLGGRQGGKSRFHRDSIPGPYST